MTKRKIRKKMCSRKKRHESYYDAKIAAQRTKSEEPLAPYSCQYCGGWHVGHGLKSRRDNPNSRKGWYVAIRIAAVCLYMVCPVWGGEIQLRIEGEPPAQMRCDVSCQSPGGFPEVPMEVPCDQLPKLSETCTVIIHAIAKKNLANAIRNLHALTGQE